MPRGQDNPSTECTRDHQHMLSNSLMPSPWKYAPWRLLKCGHFEHMQISMVEMATQYLQAHSDDGVDLGVLIGEIVDNKPEWLVTIWDESNNSNTSSFCKSPGDAETMFRLYETNMLRLAATS